MQHGRCSVQLDHNLILDPDAKLTGKINTRFTGECHAWADLSQLALSGGGAFVTVNADPVAGAFVITARAARSTS